MIAGSIAGNGKMETKLEWVLTNTYKAEMISYLSAHPELSHEIVLLAGDQYLESLSATARKSVMKMVQKLKI